MTSTPLFSVVIPVFNRASTILPSLESVAKQTVGDWECLVVDDGSEDGNALREVVASFGDPRFKYFRQENAGGGAARNTGIRAATGRYIAFLDSDDMFLPNKFEVLASVVPADPKIVFYSQALVDRGVGRVWVRPSRGIAPGEDVGAYLFVHNQFITTISLVVARETALGTLFDPALPKGQDLDFCLRLQRDGACFQMIEQPLAVWNDAAEGGRTSRTPGHEAPLAWLERSRPLLSRKAYLGYRATVLAYYLAKAKPWTALRDLFLGWLLAGVPLKVVLRHALRAYLPRRCYRQVVDLFVRAAGRDSSSFAVKQKASS
jgi:glycosyltransferase involved in cell wall biosynthesis